MLHVKNGFNFYGAAQVDAGRQIRSPWMDQQIRNVRRSCCRTILYSILQNSIRIDLKMPSVGQAALSRQSLIIPVNARAAVATAVGAAHLSHCR